MQWYGYSLSTFGIRDMSGIIAKSNSINLLVDSCSTKMILKAIPSDSYRKWSSGLGGIISYCGGDNSHIVNCFSNMNALVTGYHAAAGIVCTVAGTNTIIEKCISNSKITIGVRSPQYGSEVYYGHTNAIAGILSGTLDNNSYAEIKNCIAFDEYVKPIGGAANISGITRGHSKTSNCYSLSSLNISETAR